MELFFQVYPMYPNKDGSFSPSSFTNESMDFCKDCIGKVQHYSDTIAESEFPQYSMTATRVIPPSPGEYEISCEMCNAKIAWVE